MNFTAAPISKRALDVLILKVLAAGEMHSLGISRGIKQITNGTFNVQARSLFAALHRMEEEGWICACWEESENNRNAKYYGLTKPGRKQPLTEINQWHRMHSDQRTPPDHFRETTDIPADQSALIQSVSVTALMLLFSCTCSGQTISLLHDRPREIPFQLFSGFLVVVEGRHRLGP